MHRYKKLGKLGEGAHGTVYKAHVLAPLPEPGKFGGGVAPLSAPVGGGGFDSDEEDGDVDMAAPSAGASSSSSSSSKRKREDQQLVAIKKIHLRNAEEGLSMEAVREIKLLQELNHPNILKVLDVFNHKSNVNVVLEYLEGDLEELIRDQHVALNRSHIKAYMQMLLRGVEHCHQHWVLHRDIKPANLLMAPDGQLKLADFGLAKIYGSPNRRLTHQVCTLWYRSPELLYGARHYGRAVDMWAVGCVFAELMRRQPLFPGESEMKQLGLIFSVLGTPSIEDWPGMTSLPGYVEYSANEPVDLQMMFPGVSAEALDLLKQLLTFDPTKRIDATQALRHKYFHTGNAPTPPHLLPQPNKSKRARA